MLNIRRKLMEKQKISEDVFENILLAVAVMLYFIVINFSYYRLDEDVLIIGLKILSSIVLALGIIFLEVAYHKDSGKLAINAIEILFLSGYTLSIMHVVEVKNFVFANYILVSSYVFSVYYLTKSIIVFTKERREYLKSLSDIREIVNIKPAKKEAEKRNNIDS
jgi:hypothetical protein